MIYYTRKKVDELNCIHFLFFHIFSLLPGNGWTNQNTVRYFFIYSTKAYSNSNKRVNTNVKVSDILDLDIEEIII